VRALAEEAHRIPSEDKTIVAREEELSALLARAEGRLAEAESKASISSARFREAGRLDDAAISEALRAGSLLESGRVAEARAAVDGARALVKNTSSGFAVARLAIADAQVRAAEHPGEAAAIVRSLLGVAQSAANGDDVLNGWEARLTAGRIEV